ncbi:hypothetical protein E2562_017824 [Oryza meyeriana var. granulata]|uniref:Uncharacterized protein n=1 Tax=Oryza meyeriana var. granulata TaxID=110450 RepID=A0A6G1DYC0_9ORYZ|nr:hypothetical protein E2562_017824 [Oryza meyeriana var. granulata]
MNLDTAEDGGEQQLELARAWSSPARGEDGTPAVVCGCEVVAAVLPYMEKQAAMAVKLGTG